MNDSLPNKFQILEEENEIKNGLVDIGSKKNSKPYPLFQNQFNKEAYVSHTIQNLQTSSILSQSYFSRKNTNIIQNMLRYNVWMMSNKKYIIDRQSDTQLQIVMRSIYLQYAKNRNDNIIGQIKILNKYVLDYCIPHILSEVEQYKAYRVKASQIPDPLPRSVSLSNAGTKTLILKNFM